MEHYDFQSHIWPYYDQMYEWYQAEQYGRVAEVSELLIRTIMGWAPRSVVIETLTDLSEGALETHRGHVDYRATIRGHFRGRGRGHRGPSLKNQLRRLQEQLGSPQTAKTLQPPMGKKEMKAWPDWVYDYYVMHWGEP